ncbi:MAG: alpha/beta hydrolase [Actinomycetota bacterium]|nr:alpha/beta hydrolase [Actinomycetota bacterium]
MSQVRANGIHIEVETFGDFADPPILLIMGLDYQLTHWPEAFVEQLVGRGHRVIRFDNRDVGLSTWFDDVPAPNMTVVWLGSVLGFRPKTPYTLSDMADDTAGVLDVLGIDSAHIVGMSMGGMIAQRIAMEHPKRVRSLCSIMSSPRPNRSSFRLMRELLKLDRNPSTRGERIEKGLATFRLLSGKGFVFDEDSARREAAVAVDRAWHPEGTARQLAAIMADGDRRPALASLDVPTTVIHGTDDHLVLPKHGPETAGAIPGAEMVWIDGWGHDLPEGAWPEILDAISNLIDRTGS